MLCGTEDWRSWDELAPSVRTGERAWDRAHGVPVFEYYARHPEGSARFNAAMAEHTREAAPAIVARGDFARFGTVMDVGGGDGTLVAAIIRAHEELEGIVFDVPAGLASADATLAAAGVADRCRLVAGDVFASVPAGADAYVLKQVLHDWDDERVAAILRNCRAAMRPGARLLVLERTVPELVGADDARTLLLDVLMLVLTGGRERTEREFRGLLEAAGFATATFSEPLEPSGYRLIEAAPA
jgi:SAM-dependent methyltransferase